MVDVKCAANCITPPRDHDVANRGIALIVAFWIVVESITCINWQYRSEPALYEREWNSNNLMLMSLLISIIVWNLMRKIQKTSSMK